MLIKENDLELKRYKEELLEMKLKRDYQNESLKNTISYDLYKKINYRLIKKVQYSGDRKENEVMELLNRTFKDLNGCIYKNLIIGKREIDFLVISEKIILLIEVKEMNNKLIIKNNEFIKISKGKEYKMEYNPIKRNDEKIKMIKNIIGEEVKMYKIIFIDCKECINYDKNCVINNKEEFEKKMIYLLDKNKKENIDVKELINKINSF